MLEEIKEWHTYINARKDRLTPKETKTFLVSALLNIRTLIELMEQLEEETRLRIGDYEARKHRCEKLEKQLEQQQKEIAELEAKASRHEELEQENLRLHAELIGLLNL